MEKNSIKVRGMEIMIGDKISSSVTRSGGYWKGTITGRVVGFTKNDRVKIKTARDGIKCVLPSNIHINQGCN